MMINEHICAMAKIPRLSEPGYHDLKFVSKRPAHAGRFAELLALAHYLFWLTKVNKSCCNSMNINTLTRINIYSRLMIFKPLVNNLALAVSMRQSKNGYAGINFNLSPVRQLTY